VFDPTLLRLCRTTVHPQFISCSSIALSPSNDAAKRTKRCHRFLTWRNCVNQATCTERSENVALALENDYLAYAASGFRGPQSSHGLSIAIGGNPAQTAQKLP
jgi:hypothetical protein